MSHDTAVFDLGGRRVSRDVPPLVIAEIGLNHGGSLERALTLVDAAAGAGAHAVKLQTLEAAALVAPDCPAPAHVAAESLVDFFATFELDESAHRQIAARVRSRGLRLLSTPLSESAVSMLDRLGVDAYKIASGDLTWDDLVARCASTGKPLIISTGLATLAEVENAVTVARAAGARHIALLHCVSAYPVPPGSENLLAVRTLAERFRLPVGLSDHGSDAFAYPIAVALGASLYERHLVLADDADAVDRAVSSTPDELAVAVRAGRRAWQSLGTGQKACLAAEAGNLTASRRSLCAARDLPAGAVLSARDLVVLRPATGLPPSSRALVVGCRLTRNVARGQPITRDMCGPATKKEVHRVA